MADDVIAATIAGNASVQTAAQIRHVAELVDELRGKHVCIATAGAGDPILITDPRRRQPAHDPNAVSDVARGQSRAA